MLPRNRSRSGVRAGVKLPHVINWTCSLNLIGPRSIRGLFKNDLNRVAPFGCNLAVYMTAVRRLVGEAAQP